MRAFLALLLAAALTGCGLPPPRIGVSAPGPIELPFRVALDGLILVTGRVNGRHDVDFILDTGAPVTVLMDNENTRPLALDTSKARRLGPADDPAVPVGVIQGGFHVDFGPIAMAELTAVLIPGASLPCPERFAAIGFGGVVGADLFRRFVVEVDWGTRKLRFHEPAGFTPPPGAREVPLVFSSGHPYVDVQVDLADGRSAATRLHLDTGMNSGLTLTAGSRPEFTMPLEGKVRTGCFVSGKSEAREGSPVGLRLGAARLDAVTPVYGVAEGASVTRRNGALGAAVLSRQRLIVDYPRERIFIGS